MTNEEIICEFMEPNPHEAPMSGDSSALGWWWCGRLYSEDGTTPYNLYPAKLDLDRLHEVESRLTGEQWTRYIGGLLLDSYDDLTGTHKRLVHATATQKIKALAAVLRS